jgi:hypothetical protein
VDFLNRKRSLGYPTKLVSKEAIIIITGDEAYDVNESVPVDDQNPKADG